MNLEAEPRADDPADQLRADIESAIASQAKSDDTVQSEPAVDDTSAAEAPEKTTDDSSDDRQRDEKGRFKAKGDDDTESVAKVEKAVETEVKTEGAEDSAPAIKPPPGFSVASKAAWDELPQSVRNDIAKREQEIDNGFKRYSGLGKFAEEAERNGTTLQNAISDYAAIEGALRQNVVGGIEFICQRLGVDPRQLAHAMAGKYIPAAAADTGQQGAPVAQQAQHFDPAELTRQFQQIARAEADSRVAAMRAETEAAQIQSQMAEFRADPKNKFFENVRQDMAALVQAGKANTLKEAYEAACWLNPDTRAILINETNGGRNKEAANAVSKARNAAKAIGGSPSPGVNPDAKTRRGDMSLDDEIRAAVDAQMGQI